MAYRFKYYFKDGTIEKSNGYGNTPKSLYNDFDNKEIIRNSYESI